MAVLLAVLAMPGAFAATAPRVPEARPIASLPIPAARQGLTAVEGHLWTIDTRTGVLLKIRASDGKTVATLRSPVAKPRALAWDGKALWCAGARGDRLYRIDPKEGRLLKSLPAPKLKASSSTTLEALAWDGGHLWVGIAAGWSSSLIQVDPESGKVLQSIFAEGYPRALASDGKSLWMANYNEGKSPSMLARWTILKDATKMSLTHTFVACLPGRDPSGLTWDGKGLWYADRGMKAFQKLRLPAEPMREGGPA